MTTKALTPQQATEVFTHYFNLGDIDQLIGAYYAPQAVLAGAPGAATAGPALRSALSQYFEARGTMRANTRHVLVSGDTALLVIDWTLSGTREGTPFELKGTSTDVVQKQADQTWRCVIDNPHGVS